MTFRAVTLAAARYSRLRASLRKRIIKKWYHAIRDLALRNGTMRLGAPISKPIPATLIVIPPALRLPLLCDRYSLHSLRARFGRTFALVVPDLIA